MNNLTAGQKKIKILIVDDDPGIQKFVARALKPEKYEIVIASEGEEAFGYLTKSFFDIVISDIVMPKMDGITLTQKIVESFSTDVILMTGKIDHYSYDQFIQAGACDFVQKPFPPDEILLRVRRVLRERQLREDLLRSHEELVQSQKLEAIGQLAAGIAHEINTPIQYVGDNITFLKETFESLLAVAQGYERLLTAVQQEGVTDELIEEAKIIREDTDLEFLNEEVPAAIQQSLEGIERVTKIVKSMKAFSHPGGEDHALADINNALENSVAVAKNEWKHVADLTMNLDESLPHIFCNPGEINQVFLNLIINASHAIEEGLDENSTGKGRIRIETQNLDKAVEIRIKDTGKGISKAEREKIFAPFFTTKKIGKGTGQGLAISHSVIVDKHRGNIRFESTQGKGTTFFVTLPKKRETGKKS